MVLRNLRSFADDYLEHVREHRCLDRFDAPVPCVSSCPAGVDIPGYIALIRDGRPNDAVRLIRKDKTLPFTCGYVCEHPCEAYCRRTMLDDALNIRGLKRYAVDKSGDIPVPESCVRCDRRRFLRLECGILSASNGTQRNNI